VIVVTSLIFQYIRAVVSLSYCTVVTCCCYIQLTLLSIGMENVLMPSAELCQNILENNLSLSSCISGTRRRWQRGQLEFEAMMRQLDNAVSTLTSLTAC